MKKLSIILALLIFFLNTEGQSIFKVVAFDRNILEKEFSNSFDSIKCYRIVPANSSIGISPSYPLIPSATKIDTLSAIAELLAYEGDTRICTFPIMCYNQLSSQLYMGVEKNYSIQVEALFLINQLVLNQPFFYSSYPVLMDRQSHMQASVSGNIIDKAFVAYHGWYELLKKNGIEKMRLEKKMPLDGTNLKWY